MFAGWPPVWELASLRVGKAVGMSEVEFQRHLPVLGLMLPMVHVHEPSALQRP